MKISLLCVLLLLGLVLASSPPSSDKLYGVQMTIGGNFTEEISNTVQLDVNGTSTFLLTNFVSAPGAFSYSGISTLDPVNSIIYYSTDYASTFIWGTNFKSKLLVPPLDVGATKVLSLKYNVEDSSLYIVFIDKENIVLFVTVSTLENGPARLIGNFSFYLDPLANTFGLGTLSPSSSPSSPSSLYFTSIESNQTGGDGKVNQRINFYNSTSSLFSGTSIFTFPFVYLHYDSTSLWGVTQKIEVKKLQLFYYFTTVDPITGSFTSSEIKLPFTTAVMLWTFSPSSSILYFYTLNVTSSICYATVEKNLGSLSLNSPICSESTIGLADLEVDWM